MGNFIETDRVAIALGLDRTDDVTLAIAVSAASDFVRDFCGRDFTAVTAATVASARYFNPTGAYVCRIDDCTSVTSVATDDAADGNYSTSWSASDWQAQPVGGQGPYGTTGWPYTAVVAVSGRYFNSATFNLRPLVKVTAKWGWSAIPDAVEQATLLLANEFYKASREAPFGTANLADFGPVLIRGNQRIPQLLRPYCTAVGDGGRFLVA